MQNAPTTWPEGTELAGSVLLRHERNAWHLGYAAALAEGAAIIQPAPILPPQEPLPEAMREVLYANLSKLYDATPVKATGGSEEAK